MDYHATTTRFHSFRAVSNIRWLCWNACSQRSLDRLIMATGVELWAQDASLCRSPYLFAVPVIPTTWRQGSLVEMIAIPPPYLWTPPILFLDGSTVTHVAPSTHCSIAIRLAAPNAQENQSWDTAHAYRRLSPYRYSVATGESALLVEQRMPIRVPVLAHGRDPDQESQPSRL